MVQNFTLNHLIRYIYKETSASETLAIAQQLDEDYEMQKAYEELISSYQQLPKASFAPSDRTIGNILSYSKQTTVEPQH